MVQSAWRARVVGGSLLAALTVLVAQGAGSGRPQPSAGDIMIAIPGVPGPYCVYGIEKRLREFTEDGRFLREWGSRGRWRSRFRYPTGVAVTSAGEVLVADGFNHRVQRFTSDGRYLDTFGGTGFGFAGRWPRWFALAKDLAVDDAGNIYVTDAFNGRLQTFTADGQLRAVWGDPQRGDDEVDYASGVAIASAGRVYVGDFSRSEIWEIACQGTESTP